MKDVSELSVRFRSIGLQTPNTGRQYPGEALVTLSGKPGKAMADQIMAADKSRLKNPMGSLSKADMTAVETAILIHLGMPR